MSNRMKANLLTGLIVVAIVAAVLFAAWVLPP